MANQNVDLLDIQTDIEKELTDYMREELNNNTKDVLFALGYYYDVESADRAIYVEDEDNPYLRTQKEYVRSVIETYDGNVLAVEGLFNIEYSLPMTFQIDINSSETTLNDVIEAINQIKNKNRGKLKRLKVNIGTEEVPEYQYFTMTVTSDNLTPSGDIEEFEGKQWVFATITFHFDLSLDIVYGNQMELSIRPSGNEDEEYTEQEWPYQRVYPIIPNFNRDVTPENIQTYGTTQAMNIAQESEFTFTVGLVMKDDDLHWKILEDAVKKNKLQTTYDIKMQFYRFDGDEYNLKFELIERVIILDSSINMTIGEEMGMALTFQKYLDDSGGV